jgi:hypothetical protein
VFELFSNQLSCRVVSCHHHIIMSRRKAAVAEPAVLDRVGALASSSVDSDTLVLRNWTFRVTHRKICNTADLAQLARSFESALSPFSSSSHPHAAGAVDPDDDHISLDGQKLHLPPMLFLDDIVSISAPGGGTNTDNSDRTGDKQGSTISWSAKDCLFTWAQTHTAASKLERPLRVVQVPYANVWTKMNASLVSVHTQLPVGASESAPARVSTAPLATKQWDWTFTSDYMCTLRDTGNELPGEEEVVSAVPLSKALQRGESGVRATHVHGSNRWRWERASKSGLDIEMLKSTEDPILFFDETTLYQV